MDDVVTRAAAKLLAVRAGSPRIPDLGDAAPAEEAQAWAVQSAVLASLGGTVGGWKCAAPPGKPHSGAMLDARGIKTSPATWPVPRGERIGIETEIAFRLGRDLPPRGAPYSREEVLDAVAGCFPAVELVSSRYLDPAAVPLLSAMADSVAHAGLVIGADVPEWRALDLPNLTVRQSYGGEVQVERVGGNPAGDPVISLVWLANHLPTLGMHLRAGEVVTTGSCTGLIWVESGSDVVGEFRGSGRVCVSLT